MIQYKMMDVDNVVSKCLHNGPLLFSDTDKHSKEEEPSVQRFLASACTAYGSCAVIAYEEDSIVGLAWFYPTIVFSLTGTHLCIQSQEEVKKFAAAILPEKSSLKEKELRIACFQVVNDYKAMAEGRKEGYPSYLHKGIGQGLLETLINWARIEGWDRIVGSAIPHIPPLMAWSCHLSIERYKKFGFAVAESSGKNDGGISQRRGFHGEAMKKMWEPYGHLSDEEISKQYIATLDLKKK